MKGRISRGILREALSYFDSNIEPINAVIDIIKKLREGPTGIKMGAGSMSLKNVSITGFSKALDVNDNSSIKAENLSISDCLSGIHVNDSVTSEEEPKMGLELDDCNFNRVETAVKAPDSYDIKAKKTNFTDVNTAFDIYVPENELIRIGLPRDTPQELICEVIRSLQHNENKQDQVSVIANSRLTEWLGIAANAVTIATPFVEALISYATTA